MGYSLREDWNEPRVSLKLSGHEPRNSYRAITHLLIEARFDCHERLTFTEVQSIAGPKNALSPIPASESCWAPISESPAFDAWR